MIDPNQDGPESRATGPTVMLVFVGLLLAQIAIPVQQVLSNDEGGPVRFGWQMFAMVRDRPLYVVRHGSGGIDTVDIVGHLVRHRPEIDLASELPPHLCRVLKDVSEVVVRWPTSPQRSERRQVEHTCP